MNDRLFRKEFVKETTDFAGRVSIPPQRALAIMAMSSVAMLLLGISALLYLKKAVTEQATGFVTVDANREAIGSPLMGTSVLQSLLVKEGQRVVPGNPIAIISAQKFELNPILVDHTNAVLMPVETPKGEVLSSLLSAKAGYVDRIMTRAGTVIRPGEPLLTLATEKNKLKVELLVSSRVAARISPKEILYVRVNSYPLNQYGTLSSRVEGISSYAASPLEIASLYGIPPPTESKFVLSLLIEDKRITAVMPQLKPGMTTEVQIPLEKQSILAWISESLLRYKEVRR